MYKVRYNTSYSAYIIHSTRGQEREEEKIVEATLTITLLWWETTYGC